MTQANKKADAVSFGASMRRYSTYWASLIVGLKHFSNDFYKRNKVILAWHQVSDMTMTQLPLKEGGMRVARRKFLQVQREGLVTDVCGRRLGISVFVLTQLREDAWRTGFLFTIAIAFRWHPVVKMFFAGYEERFFRHNVGVWCEARHVTAVWVWTANAGVFAMIIHVDPHLNQALVRNLDDRRCADSWSFHAG